MSLDISYDFLVRVPHDPACGASDSRVAYEAAATDSGMRVVHSTPRFLYLKLLEPHCDSREHQQDSTHRDLTNRL